MFKFSPTARPLGDSYGRNGYQYKLIVRDGMVAIFGQIRKVEPFDYVAYEVIHIEVKPAITIVGKDTPEREIAPGNEDWGDLGWTYKTLEQAKIKMRAIMNGDDASGDDDKGDGAGVSRRK